ncbi:sarcosine oxidase subunit gamma [Hyphomicrobium sp.]|uniref:sarcosine oxidase subunit gamma n=1 Tax=Hyphomicrobium sp. TaxID=82 RepID=UPI003F70FBD1
MAEQALVANSALLHSAPIAHKSITVAARETLTMASIGASLGKSEALKAAIRNAYGVALPDKPGRVEGNGIAFVWAGPDQWLAVAERGTSRDLETEFKAALMGLASVVDHSDGRVVIRISGPRARDVLAKGVPVDLDPRAFRPGDAAITHASHIGVILWQLDDAPTYEVALFRSYADSFAHWIDEAATEFVSVRD